MFGFLKRLFGGGSKVTVKRVRRGEDETLASVDGDELGAEGRESLRSMINETTEEGFFEGRVQHGYSLLGVSDPSRCPRCKAATRQHYANFVYLVSDGARAMLAPAGYFCTRCPTVVVDEEMIKTGTHSRTKFGGVIGLTDDEDDAPPQFFRTWDGVPVLIPGEELWDSGGRGSVTYSPGKQRKMAQRKRMAKASRKRNRK